MLAIELLRYSIARPCAPRSKLHQDPQTRLHPPSSVRVISRHDQLSSFLYHCLFVLLPKIPHYGDSFSETWRNANPPHLFSTPLIRASLPVHRPQVAFNENPDWLWSCQRATGWRVVSSVRYTSCPYKRSRRPCEFQLALGTSCVGRLRWNQPVPSCP